MAAVPAAALPSVAAVGGGPAPPPGGGRGRRAAPRGPDAAPVAGGGGGPAPQAAPAQPAGGGAAADVDPNAEWSAAPMLRAPHALKRIILVRHAQSTANADWSVYTHTPDWLIPLTERGKDQARRLGRRLRPILGDSPLFWYVSPFVRTRQTYLAMMDGLGDVHVAGAREEPRITEQQFANYQPPRLMNYLFGLRQLFGRFYFQFPHGESSLKVYQRVNGFVRMLTHDVERMATRGVRDATVIAVTHGITMRAFLMRWFRMRAEEFEQMKNPKNCAFVVLERGPDGRYTIDSESARQVTFPRPNSGPPPWQT
eukprot:TRINITY_DN10544_c0_g2_i1.p1 TRINITY_DN10544_c0_g2~~TRINITY_DN10544_c0_g2_i1.p1  ORF type:complete len:340 (+),score=99.16 TRINITY_DN10544_c0_g2_i1:85-1020(+)